MQDLCVTASTKPAEVQAPAGSVPKVFQAVCIAAQAETQQQCWELLCSTLGSWAKGRAPFHKGCPARAQLRSAPIHSKAQLPGLRATSELDHHSAGNKALTEGFKVCTDSAGWRELIQPEVWKVWRALLFQSTKNCFLTVALRSLTLASFIFPFPRKVTT